MKDSEITALAAKAYGDAPEGFSPLTDDGDALRLAVKLGISTVFLYSKLEGSFERGISARHMEIDCEQWGDDLNAATRRAITRSAAEIGKTMKS